MYPTNATLQHSFRIAINKLQMRPGQWHNFTAPLKPGRHFTFNKATLAMRKKQRYGGLSPVTRPPHPRRSLFRVPEDRRRPIRHQIRRGFFVLGDPVGGAARRDGYH